MSLLWILFTLFAAFMQAWRNAFQKQLSTTVDVYGVTFARFIFALPLSLIYLYFVSHQQALPMQQDFSPRYWVYVSMAATAQIVATILMVLVFKQKNYAIGVGLAKSEAILAALIGVLCFSEHLSLWGWIGVLIGTIAVILLSFNRNYADFKLTTLALGLGSGLFFAVTSLLVREASLELNRLPYLNRAAWVLCSVIGLQCALLLGFLVLFKRQTLRLMMARISVTLKVSTASFLASLGWFTAMSMQSVAIVKTLGQIEVFFSLLISMYFFKDKLNKNSYLGLGLIVVSAIMVIWV